MNERWVRRLSVVGSVCCISSVGAASAFASPGETTFALQTGAAGAKGPLPVAAPKPVAPPVQVAVPAIAVPTGAVPTQPATQIATAVPSESSAVPRFVKLLPERYNKDEITIAVDQELKLAIVVEHPEGLPIVVEALGLPPGASFDPELHSISWRPTEAERGTYQVRLRASAGRAEVSRMLILNVRGNQPPTIGTIWFDAVAGEAAQWSVGATDPEGGPVVVSTQGLPKGATADADGNISFHPTLEQVGEHAFKLSVSDGKRTTAQTAHIRVTEPTAPGTALEEWTSFWLPGVGYTLYTPRDTEVAEMFHGLTLEIVVAAWIHRNDNRGPSHGRVYINAELLNSDVKDAPLLFTYAAGLSLSFERNPSRSWLIPFYGLELGGMVHQQLGGLFQTTPHLGVHLYSNPNVFVGARVGYRLVPSRIDTLAGLHAALTADFSIW